MVWKFDVLTLTIYDPGLSRGNRKLPEAFVCAGCSVAPVAIFSSDTRALATAAPVASDTEPPTAPVTILWERIPQGIATSRAKHARIA
jgi:hypothetical protein